ncbi:MAG: hypothetical protein FJX74_15370 [Armatimonadetes bacterium]|nr:hypothetical protein [Armatimonadota bacterium]
MSLEDVHLFWSQGNRRHDSFSYGELMADRHGTAAADGLQYVEYFEKRDITLAAVRGEEWRQFFLREPGWLEATDENWPFGKGESHQTTSDS